MNTKFFIVLMIAWLIALFLTKSPKKLLQIIVCDVGQGDAILIQYERWQLLIDGGDGDLVLACLDANMPFFDRKIEIVLATHPHSDHIGGLGAVLKGYTVSQVISNGQTSETDDFKRLEKAIQRKKMLGLEHRVVKRGDTLTTPASNRLFSVSVLSPLVNLSETSITPAKIAEVQLLDEKSHSLQDYSNYNDGSIALLLQFGEVTALFMGDLEERGEQALLEAQLITDVDLLKVGHHGSKTSTTPGFIEYSRPEISLISVGEKNTFGHPSPQVVSLLKQNGSQILRTDLEGTISLLTDGTRIWRAATNFNVKEHSVWLSFHHFLNQSLFLLSTKVQNTFSMSTR